MNEEYFPKWEHRWGILDGGIRSGKTSSTQSSSSWHPNENVPHKYRKF
jgi:hypothetical protein